MWVQDINPGALQEQVLSSPDLNKNNPRLLNAPHGTTVFLNNSNDNNNNKKNPVMYYYTNVLTPKFP